MKKLFFFLLFLIPLFTFAQWQTQTIGAPKTITLTKGISAADSAMILTRACFPDTIAANRGGMDTLSGVVIRTCDDSIRMRSNDKTKWITIGAAITDNSIITIITGDTTVLDPVIDSTNQPYQRVLYGIGNNHIGSSKYFLFDSIQRRLLVGFTQPAAINSNWKIAVSGDMYASGILQVNKVFAIGTVLTTDTTTFKPIGINPAAGNGEIRRFATWGNLIKPFVDTINITNFSAKVRSLFAAGINMIYSNGTFSADTTTGATKLATQGDITRALPTIGLDQVIVNSPYLGVNRTIVLNGHLHLAGNVDLDLDDGGEKIWMRANNGVFLDNSGYTTLIGGTSADSILTWNSLTGRINKRKISDVISGAVPTPTFQTVTTAGNTTTNPVVIGNTLRVTDGTDEMVSFDYTDFGGGTNYGSIHIGVNSNPYQIKLLPTAPTAQRLIFFPDASGTVALTSDIAAAAQDLQSVTDNGNTTTNQVIINNTSGLLVHHASGTALDVHNDGASTSIVIIAGDSPISPIVRDGTPVIGFTTPDGLPSILYADTLSGNRAWRLPDASGTIALISDIAALGAITGTTDNLLKVTGTNINTNKTFHTLPYAASITKDMTTGYNDSLHLTGNAAISYVNAQSGDQHDMFVTNNSPGGHTLTVAGNMVNINPGSDSVTAVSSKFDGNIWHTVTSFGSSGGSSTFVGLTDGPGVFIGKTLNFTRVNAGETALEYRTPSQVLSDIGAQASGSYQPLDGDLTSYAANSTNGILAHTAANTTTARTITGTSNEITVTNGDGVSGAPTISLPSTLTLTGKATTFQDNNWTMQDDGDNTKLLKFQLSSIATATTRTAIWPDANITVARSDAAQTFTGVQTFSSAPAFSTGTATVNSVTANVMTKQINSVSSNSVTPVDGASVNIYEITASAGLTVNAPSGTQHDGDELYLLIEGGGTARTIAFNAIFSPSTDLPLPTTTVVNKLMVLKFIYTTMGSRNKYLFMGFVNNYP